MEPKDKKKWAKKFLKSTITHYLLRDHLIVMPRKCGGLKHPCWIMVELTLTLSMSKDYHDVNLGGSYGCGVGPGQGIRTPRRVTMPYKDEEKRRRFDRDYKRKIRQKKALSIPSCQAHIRKAYLCIQVPHFRLPGIIFKGGLFVTDDPTIQAVIEADSAYGVHIFSWILEQ